MHSILECARWFTEKNLEPIRQDKLQLLCYYSQVWSFAVLGSQPLFCDKFEAHIDGPRNPRLHSVCEDREFVDTSIFENAKNTYFSDDELELLELVWDIYGGLPAERLNCLVRCDIPWKETRTEMSPRQNRAEEISFDKMMKYYQMA